MKKILSLILAILVAFTALGVQPARAVASVIYVDDDASGAFTGASWTDAYKKLQNALDAAAPGDHVWVAAGIYYPDEGTLQVNNDRTESFVLEDDVDIYGGFAGTESQLSQRNIAANPTILSGDIDKDDINTDGNNIAETTADLAGSNSYHVVLGGNSSSTTILDGFIITSGNANDVGNNTGGGMYNLFTNPTLVNLTFSGNYAGSQGGGLCNYNSSTSSLTNVIFTGNSAAIGGGGMQNISNSHAVLTNVTFSGNSAPDGGGMGNIINSQAVLTNVTFSGNTSTHFGGGLYVYLTSQTTLTNVNFIDNSSGYGGGMYNLDGHYQELTNVTFSGNTAGANGGGLNTTDTGPYEVRMVNVTFSGNTANQNGGGIYSAGNGSPTLTNVTLSGNSATNQNGGGMYSTGNGYPTLMNVTFSENSASGLGGGAYISNSGPVPLTNTIIANSVTGGDCVLGGTAFIAPPSGNSLLEDSSNACGLTNGVSGNIVGSDPLLGPLQNNGGSTETHALLNGSPAFNTGTNTGCPTTDQRGAARPQGGTCDIGAVEVEYYKPVVQSTGAQDGWILESTETSGNGGTMNSAASLLYLGDNAVRKQYRSILSFNTASLPDNAVITKVTLKLKKQGIAGGGNPVAMFQGIMTDVKKGMFGAAPLALGDFNATASKTVGPASPALTAGWYALNLTPAKGFINKLSTNNGLTQVRLRFKVDDNNDAIANYLKIYSGNAALINRPQLIVEYYLP